MPLKLSSVSSPFCIDHSKTCEFESIIFSQPEVAICSLPPCPLCSKKTFVCQRVVFCCLASSQFSVGCPVSKDDPEPGYSCGSCVLLAEFVPRDRKAVVRLCCSAIQLP